MQNLRNFVKRLLVISGLVFTTCSMAFAQALPQAVEPPGVPNILQSNETQFQHETHFLTFIGSFVPESAQSAKAYYAAIDPGNTKPTFTKWLVNAGFIQSESEWSPTGTQLIACDLPGCDFPSHQPDGSLTHGYNIINTDSHAIVLNAADLGFVRNQFVRCLPSCTASNPIIYTYLENYPVAPFAQGGSNFGNLIHENSSYPTQAEAAAAISSALTRPGGNLTTNPVTGNPCTLTHDENPLLCSISRIADVAFEWSPPPNNPTSSTRYGKLYAYVFDRSVTPPTETITVPASLVGLETPNYFTGGSTFIQAGDPFPPNLDFLGFKPHPGVCLICHGGSPKKLTSTGAYPNQGNIQGFRYLPLDIRNLVFTSDTGSEQPGLPVSQAYTSRLMQEAHLKAYNLAVLKTVTTKAETDDQGVTRVPHLREVITGWYTDPGGPLFGRTTQNSDFIPVSWREPIDGGTAPVGSELLYKTALSPSCRSCHFNRELSLDFGTVGSFKQNSDLLQLLLLPYCQSSNPDPKKRPMPLAHFTYERLWQANATTGGSTIVLPDGFSLANTADQIAQFFGYSSTAGYCASHP